MTLSLIKSSTRKRPSAAAVGRAVLLALGKGREKVNQERKARTEFWLSATCTMFSQFSNHSSLSHIIPTKRFDFRPKLSTHYSIEEDQKAWMFIEEARRNDQIVSLVLERNKIKIIEPRRRPNSNACIRPTPRNPPRHFDVG